MLREARENESKAQTIENAVYDLKAVNPNKADDSDKRTPTQLLEVIDAKGRDVALARLKQLIGQEPTAISVLSFIDSLPAGPRAFATWDEYEQHLRQERDSWDR